MRHTATQHNRYDSSVRVISPSHRDLYLTTHNTHNRQTSMTPIGIRTRNPSKRAAADRRLRPRRQWDRLLNLFAHHIYRFSVCRTISNDQTKISVRYTKYTANPTSKVEELNHPSPANHGNRTSLIITTPMDIALRKNFLQHYITPFQAAVLSEIRLPAASLYCRLHPHCLNINRHENA